MNTKRIPIEQVEPVVAHSIGIHYDSRPGSTAGPSPSPGFPRRILIVDDEADITRSLRLNLQSAGGYAVCTENDSSLALDVARAFRPHLILLDVLMPHLDGCDVAARIHADPELKATPIVFLTALAGNEDTGGHAVTAGATIFLAKPVDTGELIHCIEQTLNS